MQSRITTIGLETTIKRLIALLKSQDGYKKSHEIVLTTVDDKNLSLYLTEIPSNTKQGYYVLLDFSQYILGNDEDGESLIEYDEIYEHAVKRLLKSYPCFFYTETLCILANIDENCDYFYHENEHAIHEIYNKLILALNAYLCPCGKNMVIDDEGVCFNCSLNASDIDVARHHCPICQHSSLSPVVKMSCCNQYIHKACIEKNNVVYKRDQCPLCRKKI